MKTRIWIGWTVTGLMAALMLLSAGPDVLRVPGAISVFRRLGYPPYLLLFLGTAKILGVAAVLTPGVGRLKEWAFAGLTFDLCGALYSHLSVDDPPSVWMPAAIGLVLMAGSYIAFRMRPSRADALQNRRTYVDGAARTGPRLGLST
jgi:DoxX-like protein